MSRPRTVERITFNCQYCGSIVEERLNKYKTRKRFNCKDKECIIAAKKHLGCENGMYGKTHTDQVKLAQAKRARDTHSGISYIQRYGLEKAAELKKIRGSTFKKGWTDNPERVAYFKGKKHTDITKQKIGIKSSKKFTPEYKNNHRKKMEASGYWIKGIDRSDWEVYRSEANWIAPMWDILVNEACKDKFSRLGVFNSRKQKRGVVRDHIYSRREGFNNGVFPEILRHPCNCQVLTVSENSSKRDKSCLTLEELFYIIETYDEIWDEQETVLKLIEDYRRGKRWNRKEVVSG